MRYHVFSLLGSAMMLTSCAGMVTAWKNDPLQSYAVKGPSIYAMTGDRRTAIFTNQTSAVKYCAESLPDAVAAMSASSSAGAGYKGAEGKFTDATAVGILQTFHRTEIAEVSRQLGWNTCLAWSQGAITNAEYHELLKQIVAGSVDVMKVRATQVSSVQTAPSGGLLVTTGVAVPVASPTPTPTPTPTATPSPKPGGTPTPTPTPTPPPS